MSKYTPGPWRVSPDHPTIIRRDFQPISDEGELIGSACGHTNSGFYPSEEESIANARLISAAPELLAALVEIMTFEEYFQDSGPLESRWMSNELKAAISACESAIKKATE